MFKKIENKIKEIALQIHNSSDNENIYEDAKYIYELAVIYRFLSCLLYTSPSPRDQRGSRMPSSA